MYIKLVSNTYSQCFSRRFPSVFLLMAAYFLEVKLQVLSGKRTYILKNVINRTSNKLLKIFKSTAQQKLRYMNHCRKRQKLIKEDKYSWSKPEEPYQFQCKKAVISPNIFRNSITNKGHVFNKQFKSFHCHSPTAYKHKREDKFKYRQNIIFWDSEDTTVNMRLFLIWNASIWIFLYASTKLMITVLNH